MKNSRIFYFLVFSSLLIAACSPTYYIPNTQNVPSFTSKGQSAITLAANGNQGELQGSFAATEHLGILVNTALYFPRNAENGSGGSGYLGELGAGYFSELGENFSFETYGLIAVGSMENHFPHTVSQFPATTGDINSKLLRVGIQPSFSYRSDFFEACLSTRLQSLNYTGITGTLIFDGQDQYAYLNSNSSLLQLEPALTLRAGIENVKFQAQYVQSFNFTNSEFRQAKNLVSLGVKIAFN